MKNNVIRENIALSEMEELMKSGKIESIEIKYKKEKSKGRKLWDWVYLHVEWFTMNGRKYQERNIK